MKEDVPALQVDDTEVLSFLGSEGCRLDWQLNPRGEDCREYEDDLRLTV